MILLVFGDCLDDQITIGLGLLDFLILWALKESYKENHNCNQHGEYGHRNRCRDSQSQPQSPKIFILDWHA